MYSSVKKTKPSTQSTRTELPRTTENIKRLALDEAGSIQKWKIGLFVGVAVFVLFAGFSKFALIFSCTMMMIYRLVIFAQLSACLFAY